MDQIVIHLEHIDKELHYSRVVFVQGCLRQAFLCVSLVWFKGLRLEQSIVGQVDHSEGGVVLDHVE